MAHLLNLTRVAAEPSLIIMWSGQPSAWRWRGRMYDLAELLATWEDGAGRRWYRVLSEEGLTFLLGRDRNGWTAALWQQGGEKANPTATAAGRGSLLPVV